MTEHSWVVEIVSGGHVGEGEFYLCTVCGACGGSAFRVFARSDGDATRKPRPFFPGPALDVSDDCDVAHEQISYYTRGFLGYVRSSAFDHKQHALLIMADRYTPKKRERVGFYGLAFDCRTNRNMSLDEVRNRLVVLGFRFDPRTCIQCGEPNDRYADDPIDRCYGCEYKRSDP